MKKIIFFFACLTLGVLGAQVNAQTLTSSTITFEPCFNEVHDSVATADCKFVWDRDGKTYVKDTITSTQVVSAKGCTITYNLNLTVTKINCLPDGCLKGAFTVNAEGKQIYFSQGNLQYLANPSDPYPTTHKVNNKIDDVYDTQSGVFRFAENQYERFTNDNNYGNLVGYTYRNNSTKWIDLFLIGYSGYLDRMPYERNSVLFSGSWWSNSINDDNANYDWGVWNAIYNGGDEPGLWRVLTYAEWDYLLGWRKDADTKKYGVYVNGVDGYLLLPDNWTLPADSLTPSTGKEYSAAGWAVMQNAGAVFLPIAGYSEHTNNPCLFKGMGTDNNEGYYHMHNSKDYILRIYSQSWPEVFSGISAEQRYSSGDGWIKYGCAVRLIYDPSEHVNP